MADIFILILYLALPPSGIAGPIRMMMPSMEACEEVVALNQDRKWAHSMNCVHALYDPNCEQDTCGWVTRKK